MILLLKMMKEF